MSLLNTLMVNMRADSPMFDKYENRISRYGALDAFMLGNRETGSIVSPELEARAMASAGRTLQIPVLDTKAVTISNTRALTIADDENDSALYNVAWTIYEFGFTMTPGLHQNNDISYQRDFNKKITAGIYAMGAAIEAACVAALDTNKSQVYNAPLDFTVTADTLIASLANQDEAVGSLTPVMHANDYYAGVDTDSFHVIGNTGVEQRIMQLSQHAEFNDANRTLQLGDKTFHYTNAITNGAGHKATGYIVPPASLGILFRHEPDAILGTKLGTSHEWSRQTLPLLNIPIDAYYYEGAADKSAIAGASSAHLTRASGQFFAFTAEIGLVTAYNSDLASIPSSIGKFAIATT